MDFENKQQDSYRSYSNPSSIKVTVRIESRLYCALKRAADICARSLRSELKVRVIDCLTRSQEFKSPITTLTPKQGTHITIELDLNLNKKLNQIAKDSGRSKEEEIKLRVLQHLEKYELFITPDCFKQRMINF